MQLPDRYEIKVFEALFEHTLDVIAVLDETGRVVFISPSVEGVLGFRPEERVGQNPLDLVHPDDRERAEAERERIFRDGGMSKLITLRVRHKNGSWRTIEFAAQNLIDDPAVGGLVLNYRDITERAVVTEELRRLQERYEKAFQNSPDSITISRIEDGRFLEVNDGFEHMSGYSRSDVIGHSSLEINLWKDPEARQRMTEQMLKKGSVRDFAADFVNRKGDDLSCLVSAEKITLHGDPCMLAVTRDITDQRQNYERLREASELLRRDHAELTKKNIALEQVLEHLEHEKSAYRHEVGASIDNLLRPIIDRLKATAGRVSPRDVDALEDGLVAILGQDIDQYQNNLSKLTPRELDICDLIRTGKSSKEIAEVLGLSPQTIHKHRQSIRRKLQLDNRGLNLAAFLRSR